MSLFHRLDCQTVWRIISLADILFFKASTPVASLPVDRHSSSTGMEEWARHKLLSSIFPCLRKDTRKSTRSKPILKGIWTRASRLSQETCDSQTEATTLGLLFRIFQQLGIATFYFTTVSMIDSFPKPFPIIGVLGLLIARLLLPLETHSISFSAEACLLKLSIPAVLATYSKAYCKAV
jgi:hypothetical protein